MMKNILIHGLGQNSESWDNTSMYLKENNIDIICPDLFEITKNQRGYLKRWVALKKNFLL